MHFVRFIVILFLIFAIVFTYSPQGHGTMGRAWEHARPVVIQVMDGLYAAIRNFVAGTDLQDNGIDDSAPGVNFDKVITLAQGKLF